MESLTSIRYFPDEARFNGHRFNVNFFGGISRRSEVIVIVKQKSADFLYPQWRCSLPTMHYFTMQVKNASWGKDKYRLEKTLSSGEQ